MGKRDGSVDSGISESVPLDDLDIAVLDLLLVGKDTRTIADETKRPLSTVQRRIRRLSERGVFKSTVEPNFGRLGLKTGMVLLYLNDGDSRRLAQDLAKIEGVFAVSVHIGNSDIVGSFMYRDSTQLLELISKMKHMEGVQRVVWSEEVFRFPNHNRPLFSRLLGLPQND